MHKNVNLKFGFRRIKKRKQKLFVINFIYFAAENHRNIFDDPTKDHFLAESVRCPI